VIGARILNRPAIFGLTYFATATVTIATTRFDGGMAFLWLATALLIARLDTAPKVEWRSYVVAAAVGSFFATGLFGLGWIAAPGLAIINVTEGLIATLLLRASTSNSDFQSLGRVALFVVAASLAAGLCTLLATLQSYVLLGLPWIPNYQHMFTGHALGTITFTPLIAFVLRGQFNRWLVHNGKKRALEVILLSIVMSASCFLIFAQSEMPLLFLPVLFIVVAAFWLGRFGTTLSLMIVAIISTVLTVKGYGPINLLSWPLGSKLLFLQFYLAVTVSTVLPISAELSRRKRLYRELQRSEERYRLLADHSTDVILSLDLGGIIRFVSPAITALGGYKAAELLGSEASSLVASDFAQSVRDAHLRALSSRGTLTTTEFMALRSDQSMVWCESRTRAIFGDDGLAVGLVSIIRDVSARKALEMKLSAATTTDILTGLANRRAITAELDQAIFSAKSGYLAVFEIDHFKSVRDAVGYDEADRMLVQFAKAAKSAVRASDVVARIGGAEFAVLLLDTEIEVAQAVCRRLIDAVGLHMTAGKAQEKTFTATGGVTSFATGSAETFRMANGALKRAKLDGSTKLAIAA
jgi:diguanylate cyclase (GGDEF)-like protein/PAS domain S-box-containing protein